MSGVDKIFSRAVIGYLYTEFILVVWLIVIIRLNHVIFECLGRNCVGFIFASNINTVYVKSALLHIWLVFINT